MGVMSASWGRNGMIAVGVGATAGTGLIAFIIYKQVNRRRSQRSPPRLSPPPKRTEITDGGALLLPHAQEALAQAVAQEQVLAVTQEQALAQALPGLSLEQQVELKNRLDEVLACVASLRFEVMELRGGLQDIAQQIIQDVKKSVEESQRARRRRHVVHRERGDSMSSSSIYFTASQGVASSYGGETSEGGYSTANAESDYTDRDTDRETDKEGEKEQESEEEEDKSCATVLTLRQEDSQEEGEEGEEEDRSCATVLTLQQEDSQEEEEEDLSCAMDLTLRQDDSQEEGEEEGEEEEKALPLEEKMVDLVSEVSSGELALLLAQSDILHTGGASLKAEGFHLLLANKTQYGDSREFLWRLARAYNDMYDSTEDTEEKKAYAEQGREEAEIALTKNGLNAECHKWFAVLTGLGCHYESAHGKLRSSHVLKEHLDRAIALRDDDPLCFYLLGRWCYEVSTLGWLERKAAAALYETPPTSTLQEALENFLKAETLNPGFSKTMRLYIAKCHKELGNVAEAKKWTKLALKMPSAANEEEDGAKMEEELRILIDRPSDLPFSTGD